MSWSMLKSWLPDRLRKKVDFNQPVDAYRFEMLALAVEAGKVLTTLHHKGKVVGESELQERLAAMGFRAVTKGRDEYGQHSSSYVHADNLGAVIVTPRGHYPIVTYVWDDELEKHLRSAFEELIKPVAKGSIFMLKSEHGELEFSGIENLDREIRRENYAPSVLAEFNHVASDLASADPCGRISIFSGLPGTGKTNLVRAMLRQVHGAKFVIVPPEYVDQLARPQLFAVIQEFREEEAKDCPIVFVIEDADSCLVPRASDNISAIGALLNLSDGLVGATLDARIIATTNAHKLEIDKAILRAGRLCRHIEVPEFRSVDADKVLAGMTGREVEHVFVKATSLAEIYAKAREQTRGEEPATRVEESVVGFVK